MQSHPLSAWFRSAILCIPIALIVAGQAAAADTTPPTTPTGLKTTSVKPAGVSLSWNAASDNVAVTRYRIFRDGVSVGTTSSLTYTNSGLTQNTAYLFSVAALDAANNQSTPSDPLPVTTAIRTVEFTSSTVTASESAGTIQVALRLNGSAPYANTALVSVSGKATSGDDFTIASTTVTFASGATTANLPIDLIDDALPEAGETIVLTLVSASDATVGSKSMCTVTIPANDDTTPPTAPSGLATTSVTSSSIALKWNAASDDVAVVNYELRRDGGLIRTQTTTTYTNSSLSPSTGYSYTVTAVDPSGNRSTSDALVVKTPARLVTFSSSSLTYNENAGTVLVGLKLNGAAPSAVSATIGLSGSANGSDYSAATTVTFPAGSTSQNLSVSIVDDALAEASETIVMSLSSVSGAAAGSPSACTLTIRASDDTDAPTAPTGLATTSIGAMNINLTWGASSDNVSVTSYELSRDGVPIRTSSSRSYSNTGLSPSTTYVYTVVAIDPSGNRSAPSAPLSVSTLARSVQFAAEASTSGDASTVVEVETDEIDGEVEVGLTMNAASTSPVTIEFSLSGTAANGSDYSIGGTSVVIPAGSTTASIPITIIDDDLTEGFETIKLNLISVSGANIGTMDSLHVTILNNDGGAAEVVDDLSFYAVHYHRDFFRSPQNLTFGWSTVSTFADAKSVEWTIKRLDGPVRTVSRTIASVVAGQDLDDGHNTMQSWTEDILNTRHSYLITLDPNNKIAESDETNNTYLFEIDVPAPDPTYVTVSPDLEFFQNSPHFHASEPENEHEFMFKVRNTGKTIVTGAKWKLFSASLGFSRERDLGPLNPGEIKQYGYTLPITKQGEHDFTLTIDSTNAVTNERETNNSIDFVIVVSPTQGG